WPLGIDAGDPEPFAAGAELAAEVGRLQAVVFGQELEPVLFEVECRTIGGGNADTEYGLEGEAGVHAAPSGALDNQAMAGGDLLAGLEHAGLDFLACRWRQPGYDLTLCHPLFRT